MNDTEDLKFKRNLTALVEFSRIINSSRDLEFILNNILFTCMGKFFVTKGLIALKYGDNLKLKSSKGISENIISNFPELRANQEFYNDQTFKEFLNLSGLHIIEKINSSEGCIGIICLGEKLNKIPFTEDDLEFLRTILNISATAVQNSLVINELTKVNRMLDSRVNRLNSLFELSKEFGLFSESTKVARLLIYSVIGQFLVSKFAVISFEGNKIHILESKYNEDALMRLVKLYELQKLETSITKNIIDEDYPDMKDLSIELVVPMQVQGESKGLIILGKRINNMDYTETDIEFIYSVGSLAIISLENKRLFREALEKQKMEEELEIARDIQKNLFPQKIPEFSNFDIAALNSSSRQVGGDYYDIIELDYNTFCIAIGDVSGKGVPAALLMANLQAFLKTTVKQGMKLDEATELINDLISENTSDGKFITFFWAVIENESKKFTYVNAGHNHPLLLRDGKITKLDKGGMILGVMKTVIPYIFEIIQLQKDDVIVLFTDGVSEAMNKKGEEFSDEKLESLSLSLTDLSSSQIISSIKAEVQAFTSGALQSDDITLLVLKVN
ncbi:MAG: SpoIIE family protein phosphatase [Ignavibacteriaceae bacterium]